MVVMLGTEQFLFSSHILTFFHVCPNRAQIFSTHLSSNLHYYDPDLFGTREYLRSKPYTIVNFGHTLSGQNKGELLYERK